MAPPLCIKDYIGKVLLLPHTWWGEKVAKESYPNDWRKGHSEITLLEYVSKKRNKVESLRFEADDGETYVIAEEDLKKFWTDKRFKGHLSTIYYTYVVSIALLFIYLNIFMRLKLCVVFLDQRVPKRRRTNKKKGDRSTNEGCTVVLWSCSFVIYTLTIL